MRAMSSARRYAANCSLLFTEVPLLERPAAAKEAGFEAVEFWWPWPDRPVPADGEVDAFVRAISDSGVSLVSLNFYAGDLDGPDCGVVSLPDRAAEFRDNVPVTRGIGEQLGGAGFNALYGAREDAVDPRGRGEVALGNLTFAADAAARIGGTVLLEPLSGPKPYPLRTAVDVFSVLDRVERPNVGFLCDLFHLANNGDDPATVLSAYGDRVAHVQVADWPGRHEPGTGILDLPSLLAAIDDTGYEGYVSLEYVPSTDTLDSLAWFRHEMTQQG